MDEFQKNDKFVELIPILEKPHYKWTTTDRYKLTIALAYGSGIDLPGPDDFGGWERFTKDEYKITNLIEQVSETLYDMFDELMSGVSTKLEILNSLIASIEVNDIDAGFEFLKDYWKYQIELHENCE